VVKANSCLRRFLSQTRPLALRFGLAAQILDEDEEQLKDLALNMQSEDGCLWLYGMADELTQAFTKDGIEYLRQVILDSKT
jgi:hypothetical protein